MWSFGHRPVGMIGGEESLDDQKANIEPGTQAFPATGRARLNRMAGPGVVPRAAFIAGTHPEKRVYGKEGTHQLRREGTARCFS